MADPPGKVTRTFRTPNGREWTATFSDGWVEFEERGTRRRAAGPAEAPFDPDDAELSQLLAVTWKRSRVSKTLAKEKHR